MSKDKGGRPTDYTKELATEICSKIATSTKGLHSICKENKFPCVATIFNWLDLYPEFLEKYARARQIQAELLADEIIEISDESEGDIMKGNDGNEKVDHENIQRSRLRVDARKWKASKLYPKQYGEKVDITTNGKDLGKSSIIKLPDGTELEI